MKSQFDPTDPMHVAFALMVALMVVAILLVALVDDIDTDVVSAGFLGLMLAACAVAGTRGGKDSF